MEVEEVGFVARTLQLVAPQPCYDELFVKFNFFNAVCLKIVLSKCLGFSIIAGSVMVKVPQIVKLLRAKSGEGISFLAVVLEIIAITANSCYSFANGFPFTAYGEGVFLTLQTLAVGCLVLTYGDNLPGALAFIAAYLTSVAYLTSPYASMSLLAMLQACNVLIILASRMIQIVANYRSQSTGQLSFITFLLLFSGALARIFTSIQETGDSLTILTYIVASCCNGTILAQMLYYGDGKSKSKKE